MQHFDCIFDTQIKTDYFLENQKDYPLYFILL